MKRDDIGGNFVLDLIVTAPSEPEGVICIESLPINQEGAITHLVATKILEWRDNIADCQVIALSIDLFNNKIYGPVDTGTFSLLVKYDLSDTVHYQMYCKKILGFKNDVHTPEQEEIWLHRQMTKYCSALSCDDYSSIMNCLLKKYLECASRRMSNPRTKREQKFSEDNLDVATALFMNRVLAIMKDILYWGHSRPQKFNIGNCAEMKRILA